MYNQYNQRGNYSSPTSLGIDEKWERVLCYLGLWVTGLIFLFVEQRNQTVRRHARQSVLIFGSLGILGLVAGMFKGLIFALSIPLLSGFFGAGFGLIGAAIGFVTFVAWIGLMILAYINPRTIFVGPRHDRIV